MSGYYPLPSFAAAARYARTIPSKKHKRRAILHLCKMLLAAIRARAGNEGR